MVPNWAEHRFKIASWRLLGEPWAALGQPLGGLGGAKADLRVILRATPFGGSKILENALGSHSKSVVNSELSFGPSGAAGGVLGSILGSFGARFWPPRRDLQF